MDALNRVDLVEVTPDLPGSLVMGAPAANHSVVSVASSSAAQGTTPGLLDGIRAVAADVAAWLASVWDLLWAADTWRPLLDWLAARSGGVAEAVIATAIIAFVVWLWSKRNKPAAGEPAPAGPSADAGTASNPQVPANPGTCRVDQATRIRAQQLLCELPGWREPRSRQRIIGNALGDGHPLLDEIPLYGSAKDAAHAVIQVCAPPAGFRNDAKPPLCMLVDAIARDFPGDPRRDAEVRELLRLLGCN